MERRAVVAIGGNALILDGQKGSIEEQYENAVEMARHIATLVAAGWGIVLTHGNGPQSIHPAPLRADRGFGAHPAPLARDVLG